MHRNSTEPQRLDVLELRQYTLQPGRRDDLIDLFDQHFVESQEEVGMRVVGQFRDLGNRDRFVWLRAFPDMTTRARSLSAFYERHPAWQEHRGAANDTMADSDNVLLLRPATADSGFAEPAASRPPTGTTAAVSPALVTVTIHRLGSAAALEDFVGFHEDRVRPLLAGAGSPPAACFRTEAAENTFPRLPVRTGEHVFVEVSVFADADHHEKHRARLASLTVWQRDVLPELAGRLTGPSEVLRLSPTGRSALR
ncbi:NIPSNAP family protein [Streptomyces meridianus]|uniref:NIPSNAP family protein n=1 Tax=Streptomyces meridianus TaxID=2938945 RepID=A0ABT0X2B6_9ACTN|nr:NIPSNAP family protein [Streptomyces meridianus]MCM2576685.1 NIPSNAP family protein [Streptomyces meridianus]